MEAATMTPKRKLRFKLIRINLILLCLATLSAVQVIAQEELKDGFSGTLFFGGSYNKGALSLDNASDHNTKTLSSLNQDSKNSSPSAPVLMGELNYTIIETGTLLSLHAENGFGVDIIQALGEKEFLYAGLFYSKDDVWADPYLTARARSRTNQKTTAYKLGWNEILKSPFSLDYLHETITLDYDLSGKQDTRLKREGNSDHLELSYALFKNDLHQIDTGLSCILGDLSGDAQAYKGYGLIFSHTLNGYAWKLETTGLIQKKDHKAPHSKFNKTRKDTHYIIESEFTKEAPFGLKNYFVTLFASFETNDSNIGFYDSNSVTTGAGIGLNF